MNVDEAMKVARREVLGWYEDMHTAGTVLAAEVQRLRAELAEAKVEIAGLEESHYKLEAELAAAKAASVVPVKIQSVYVNKYLGSVVVFIGDEKGAVEFEAWLTKP